MSLFGNCGNDCGCGDDTILWFIILFLLIFCNNGLGNIGGCSNCDNNC